MQEDGSDIFSVDGRQYGFRADGRGQGPAMHIVGSGVNSGRDLHVYKQAS